MAGDTPLNPYQPPPRAEEFAAATPLEPPAAVAARPWGPWASIGWTLLTIVAVVAVQVVVGIVFVGVKLASGFKIDAAELATNGNLLSFTALATIPVVIGLVALLIYIRGCSIGAYLSLVRPSFSLAMMALAGLAVLIAATDFTTWLLSRPIVPPFMDNAYRTGSLPLLLLALLVAAPLTEETLFRGFLFQGISQSPWGPRWAIVLTSLLWASLHIQYDLFAIGTIVVMGLYLGWVRYRFGSVLLTMLLHAAANLIATIEVVLKSQGAG